MAEIKIEKKAPIWPWILLVLVILAIIAYLVLKDDVDDVVDDVNTEAIDTTGTYQNNNSINYTGMQDNDFNSAMTEFDTYVQDSARVGTDSVYTKLAFNRLAHMTVMKAEENNLDDSSSLDNLRGYSNTTDSADGDMEIRKNLKRVGTDVANVIESLQKKDYPNLESEVKSLKNKSDKLNDTDAFDQQQQSIRDFIRSSRDILNSMNR